jgi:hypothetical protein
VNVDSGSVINENGIIFGHGRAIFSGKKLRNRYVKGSRIFTDTDIPHEIDPEVIIGVAGYGQNMDVTPMLVKIRPNGISPFVETNGTSSKRTPSK